MSLNKQFLNHLLEILSDMEDITCVETSGEYLLYYRGKNFGGVYNCKLLIKKLPLAEKILGDVEYVTPYAGAAEMIWYKDIDDADKLMQFIEEICDVIPEPKRKKKK